MSATGIILAAGLSRRMGTANKLLTPWQGKPLLRHIVDAALASVLDEVLLVTGHEADAVQAAVPEFRAVHAEGFADGMGASLSAGAFEAQVGSDIMVLPGDMPLITVAHINAVLARAGENCPIIATDETGRRGHPVLFPARLQPSLAMLTGDSGARGILEAEDCATVEIGEAALLDFDTPEAFKA